MASQLTSIPGQDYMSRPDFVLTATQGTGAVETVAEYVIPRGEARKFIRHSGRLTLGAKDLFNGDGATVDFVLAQPIANSPRAFAAPAKVFVGAVEYVYVAAAPGAGQFTINFATKTITFGVAPAVGVDNVKVYYPPVNGDGKYTIEVYNPTERRHETFGNGSIRRINTAPQDDINSPWTMGETPWLVQDYILRVQVQSASDVSVDADNPYTQIELPFVRKGIAQVSKDELAELVGILGQ